MPISYDGRSYAEGKKIGWKDGVSALWCIWKYNIFGPRVKRWEPPAVAPWDAPARIAETSTQSGKQSRMASSRDS
jgi:hypothetical protein